MQQGSETTDAALEQYMQEVRRYAEWYSDAGLSIVPIGLQSKKALIEWTGLQQKPATWEEIEDWFESGVADAFGQIHKLFGLGIITGAVSNVVVLDCDNEDALQYALASMGVDSHLRVKTSRGFHLYFSHPAGGDVRNKVGSVGRDWPEVKGLDLRGNGGLVVAPPTISFDANGQPKHQYTWNCRIEDLAEELRLTKPWTWTMAPPPDDAKTFTFAGLDLSAVSVASRGVEEDMAEWVKRHGRKMRAGDGRNMTCVRYAGECIRMGMDLDSTFLEVKRFSEEWFEEPLKDREIRTIVESVMRSDKRNHPERHKPQPPVNLPSIQLITAQNVGQLAGAKRGSMLMDPYFPAASIVQVVGFSGHGKTLWLFGALWALSSGKDFGGGTTRKQAKVLYLDFELAVSTLSDRISMTQEMIGPMSEDLHIWSAALSNENISLSTPEGLQYLDGLLQQVKPDVLVIDTIRSAFPGMDEKSPSAWVRVNQIAKALRNAGITVVLVHHRNKPSREGMGREAGSTAQLNDLDTQIVVTKVLADRSQAAAEAAIPNAETVIRDFKGRKWRAIEYLEATVPSGIVFPSALQIGFGKVRQTTENHHTGYIAIGRSLIDSAPVLAYTKSPRQKARLMAGAGVDDQTIALELEVPVPVIQDWLK